MAYYKFDEIPQNIIDLFEKHTDKLTPFGPISKQYPECANNCWKWNGSYWKNNNRGIISTCVNKKKITVIAYRIAYILYNGDITNNQLVCHKCDNPQCVNPNHLFLGTSKDNMQDAKNKNRAYRIDQYTGAKLNENQVKEILIKIYNHEYYNILQICDEYKIGRHTINKLLNGKNWTVITNELHVPLSLLKEYVSGNSQNNIEKKLKNLKEDYFLFGKSIEYLSHKYKLSQNYIINLLHYIHKRKI